MISEPHNILILKLSSLGDIVHTLPVAATLRRNYPHARIAWMIEERYRDLLRDNPHVDEVIPVRFKRWRKNWNRETFAEVRALFTHLRTRRFDAVLDLHGLIKSGLIASLTGARVKAGFHRRNCKESLNILFTNRKAPCIPPGIHVVDINLRLLQSTVNCPDRDLRFPLPVIPRDEATIERHLQSGPFLDGRPLAALNPGAGFASKQWDLSRFAGLADRIAEELGFAVLLTWGPGEEDLVQTIAGRMKQKSWIAPPTTIAESLALYRRLSLYVGCDSGPLHLCWALGVPTVSIFGPTDPARNGAYGGPPHVSIHHKLPCSFCWKKTCPLGTRECMERVTVDNVFEGVRQCLSNPVKPIPIGNISSR
ncbi:MAG: lipopolysaccharide heptosyltransferase I [Nitrospinae bacterium CG11_big_fil_rev_8_21_14_0_20_56_8]|nr:MAG: lipopolysaccharide heptosyltransferase I [Nitrospinae bacterium CG11_big_fil_rev_8_21_14_0_20_56_8]